MATLHPLLKEKWDALGNDVHQGLFDTAKMMSVPFWWHGPTPEIPEIYHNGTICLVDTGEHVIGITAWHVYDAYRQHLETGEPFVCQFGPLTVFPENLLIEQDRRLDLATFDIRAPFSRSIR